MTVDRRLRDELVAMADADRRDRGLTDERHAARLWEILDDHECWPGRKLVGDDGEQAAWQLAQQAVFDPGLQRRCLEMLEIAVATGDAPAVHEACLEDRVRMADGRAQRYGSQFVRSADDTTVIPWPIEDVAHVDERRQRVGLPSLAEQAQSMQQRYQARSRSP